MKILKYNSNNLSTQKPIIDKAMYDVYDDFLVDIETHTLVKDENASEDNHYGDTYSYFIKDDLYHFTSMVAAAFRKECYDAYDTIVDKFNCKVLDDYSYTINYYPYATDITIIQLHQVLTQLNQLYGLVDVLDMSKDDIINEYTRIAKHINKEDLIGGIKNNIDDIHKAHGFAQGSAAVSRLLIDGNDVFYDYISVYKIKPTYTSIYRDLAQLYISVAHNKPFILFLESWCSKNNININIVKLLIEFEEEYFNEKEDT